MHYIRGMKKMIIILLALSSTFAFTQATDDVTYDKTMVDMVNIYRKVNKKKPIKWSNDLYEISKIQSKRTDSTFINGHNIVLRHDMRLLGRFNISEVLAYGNADKNKRFGNRVNPFIISKFSSDEDKLFLAFIKKYFKSLYEDITTETRVLEDLGNNKYIVSNLRYGIYSHEGSGVYIDSIIGNKTYVRAYKKITSKNITLHSTNNLPENIKDKVRIAYVIMQWHYSPGHKRIILSDGKEMSAKNIMSGGYLLSVLNVR